ncbi:hypothetical protein [Methylobacterium nonmethylotrophicum]|uniref:Uncharacterized protein n=1 Tax=Methylobacterium nonmethylotrophicum TaxID=1141884 RepID=A0A4Z0NRR6_9HYPH|nr:hypothetical protein [Methylobacterium nonmethylotrophicum]TGD99842.1 hypothetical protein EU555_11825 [Methylobacterium nonmethylotrophicum]
MRLLKLTLAALAYGWLTSVLFGDPVKPLALATVWSDRLGLEHWQVLAALCVAASAVVFVRPLRNVVPDALRPSVFVILAVLLPISLVGLYADRIRHRAVLAFGADDVEEHSFLTSLYEAPRDFQFFLHTAVLKDCKFHAWSYRKLAFYTLPPDASVNVVPRWWLKRCGYQVDRP